MLTNAIGAILSLVITLIVFVNVFMPQVKAANTTSWSTAEIALYSVVGLIGIAGFVYNVAAAFGVI